MSKFQFLHKLVRTRTNKKLCCFVLAVIACSLVCYIVFSYKRIICVEISSGRIVRQTVVCRYVLSQEIEDTRMSKLLQNNQLLGEPSGWGLDCVFTLFSPRVSLPFGFHGAASSIKSFEWYVQNYHLSEESQLLLAIATQQWLKKRANGEKCEYHDPIVELSLEIERIHAYHNRHGSAEEMVKEVNDHVVEKYGRRP